MKLVWFAPCLLAGCTYIVKANGIVNTVDGTVMIQSTSGKSMPLVLTDDAAPLRWVDGLLVELDGTFRKGAIEVDTWRVAEGPHGLSVWTGIVGRGPKGFVLHVHDQGGTMRLTGAVAQGLDDEVGQPVLVEGLVDGTMSIQPLFIVPLHGPSRATRPTP